MSDIKKVPIERPELDSEVESSTARLSRKTKDNPLMVAGLSGFFVIAAYGIYSYRRRGNLSLSNYFMQLRVTAQGAVIGCLTLGVMKSIYDLMKRRSEEDKGNGKS